MGIAVVAALVTGIIIARLPPPLSGRSVDTGTAVLAAFAGEMVPFIGAALLLHAAFDSRGSASRTYFVTASPMLSIAFTIVGVLVTVAMITSSVQGGSGRGANLDLYGRTRQTSLDEPPGEP
jgi:hypothetical protein